MKRKAHALTVASARVVLAGLLSAYIPAAAHAQTDESLYGLISSRIQMVDSALAPSGAPAAPLVGDSSRTAEQPDIIRVRPSRDADNPQDQGAAFFIPPDSRPFLPDYMTTAAPGSLLPLNSDITRERAQHLADYFARFYPDVVYHVNWDDETVNAYAWKEGSTRHVAILGGLMRHKAIQEQGLGLVLAHELGHHYGGEPTYPSGLSCEGQADYWGAGVGMRAAWGDQYQTQMLAAIDQMDAFFTRGTLRRTTPERELELVAADPCRHPPAACRKQTYQAAMAGLPKPECAGPTVPARGAVLSMLPAGVSPG